MSGFSLEATNPDNLNFGDNLLQTGYWARVKSRFAWQPFAFYLTPSFGPIVSALSGGVTETAPLLILVRKVAPGIMLAYCPHGPDVKVEDPWEFLSWLRKELNDYLPKGCALLRFDLPWGKGPPSATTSGYSLPRKSPVDVQAPDTVILEIEPDLEKVLSQMKSKTRYNIRLSARRGVSVRDGLPGDLDIWHGLAQETSRRDGIAIHSRRYFEALFDESRGPADPDVRLLIAEVNGKPVAANIISIQGRRCIYHFGASSNEERNKMPTYALQWEGIRVAKLAGCATYDLFGIPPTRDPSHPMHGLYQMKVGFGGKVTHRPGCYDFPLNRATYGAYTTAERLRTIFLAAKKHRLRRQ